MSEVKNDQFTKDLNIGIDLEIGIKIEMEHTSDPEVAKKIAMDHLRENPNYYSDPKPKDWGKKELEKENSNAMQKEFWQMTKPEYREYWINKYENWDPEIEVMKSPSSKKWYANRPDGSPTPPWNSKKLAIKMLKDEKVSMVSFIKNRSMDWEHKAHIEKAIKEGKSVPEEVLNEYSELMNGNENFIKEHVISGTIPGSKTKPITAKEIFEKIKPIKTGKTLNQIAAEENIRSYVPLSMDLHYITEQLQLPHQPALYDICLALYNHKVGNHGDYSLEGGDVTGEDFILRIMKAFIESEWDGKVVPEKQRFDFYTPGFSVPVPELILPAKEKRTTKPIPATIEGLVKCLSDLAAKDERRPEMKYVYRDDKGITASDSYVLVHIPTDLGEEFMFYDPKTGSPIDQKEAQAYRYPNYKAIIQKSFEFTTGEINLEFLLNALEPYRNTYKVIKPATDFARSSFVKVRFRDYERIYDSYKLYMVADALYCQGTRRITLNYPENKIHPVFFKDMDNEEKVGLVMPIEQHGDFLTTSFYVDLTSVMGEKQVPDVKDETEQVTEDINKMFEGATTAEVNDGIEYFTKDNAPDNIKDRFGVAKEGYQDKRADVPKTFINTLESGEKVYSVDGKYVRDYLYSDFSQGGNDMAYPEFVPIGELWYEQAMETEKDHILKHEKRERDLMVNAWYTEEQETEALTYDEAHEVAKKLEDNERGKPINPQIKPETPKTDILNTFLPKLKIVMPFISQHQIDGLTRLYRSEKKGGAQEIVDRLAVIIQAMPGTYETDDIKTDDKIIHLHYFKGNYDGFIAEKDKGSKDDERPNQQTQAFGYAIFNDDYINGEWGYINIEELKQENVELDFYWDPKPFSEVKKRWEPEKTGPIADLLRIWDEKESEIMEGLPDNLKITREIDGKRLLAYTREGHDVGIIELDPIDIHSYSPAYKKYLDQVVLRLDFFRNKEDLVGKPQSRAQFLDTISELDLWVEFEGRHYRKFILLQGNERAVTDLGIKERMRDVKIGGKNYTEAIISIPAINSSLEDEIEAAYQENTGIQTQLSGGAIKLPIVKNGDKQYFIDFKLQQLRDVHTAEYVPFTDIHDEELKAKIRGIRAEKGSNVYMKGLDDELIKEIIVPKSAEICTR